MKLAEVALASAPEPAFRPTGEPTALPPGATRARALRADRNFTWTVGAPPVELPVTVTPSVSEPPTTIAPDGVDFTLDVAFPP